MNLSGIAIVTNNIRELVPLPGMTSALADGFESMMQQPMTMDAMIPTSDSMLESAAKTLQSLSAFSRLGDAPISAILTQTSMSKFQETTVMLGDVFSTYGLQLTELELLIFQACLPNFGSTSTTTPFNPASVSTYVMTSATDTVKIDSVSANIVTQVKSALSTFLTTKEFTEISKMFKKQYETNQFIAPANPDVVDPNFNPQFKVVPFSKAFTNVTVTSIDSFLREKISNIVKSCWYIQKVINNNEVGDTAKKQTGVLTNLFGLHYNLASVACVGAGGISMWQFLARYMVEHFYMYRAINDGVLIVEDRQMFMMKNTDDINEMTDALSIIGGTIPTDMVTFPNVKFEKKFELDAQNSCYYLVTTLKNLGLQYMKTRVSTPSQLDDDMVSQGLDPLEFYRTKSYTVDVNGTENILCSDVRVIVNYNNDDRVLSGVDLSGEGWQGLASIASSSVSVAQTVSAAVDFKLKSSSKLRSRNKKIELGLGLVALIMAGERAAGAKESLNDVKLFATPCANVENYIKLLNGANYNDYFVGYDPSGNGQIVNKGSKFNIDFSGAIDNIDSAFPKGTALADGILHFYNLGVAKMTANFQVANRQAASAAFGLLSSIAVQMCDSHFKMPLGGVIKSMCKQPFMLTRAKSIAQAAKATGKVRQMLDTMNKGYTNGEKLMVATAMGYSTVSFVAGGIVTLDTMTRGTKNALVMTSDGALSRSSVTVYDNNSKNNLFFNTLKLVVSTGITWFDTETLDAVRDKMITEFYTMANPSNTLPWQGVPAHLLTRLRDLYMPSIIDIQCMNDTYMNFSTTFDNAPLDRWLYNLATQFFGDFDKYVSTYTENEIEGGSGIRTVRLQDDILKINECVTYKNNTFVLGDFVSKLYSADMHFVSPFKTMRLRKDSTPVTDEESYKLTALIRQLNDSLAPWKNSLSSDGFLSALGTNWNWMNPAASTGLGEKYGIYYDVNDNLSSLSVDEEAYNNNRTSNLSKYISSATTLKTSLQDTIALYNTFKAQSTATRNLCDAYKGVVNSVKNAGMATNIRNSCNTLKSSAQVLLTQLNLLVTIDPTNTIIGGNIDTWTDNLKLIKPSVPSRTSTNFSRSGYLAQLRDKMIPEYKTIYELISSFVTSATPSTSSSGVTMATKADYIVTLLNPFVNTTMFTLTFAGQPINCNASYFTQLSTMIDNETNVISDGIREKILRNVIGSSTVDGKVNTYDEIINTNTLKIYYSVPDTAFYQGGYGFGSLF